jgi:glycine/D-amino acid oxidase-like deaminating enzyme
VTDGGRLRATTVVRATEGYTGTLRGEQRSLLPIHSMMVATEPLPESVWKEIGLGQRETFADPRRIVIYGQRTADGRIAFGARGRYFYGREALESLFPVLRGYRITHRWGGALGVPRDWRPSVGIDRARGLAWAGGYVGEGVAASNLAGRTLAELLLDQATERVGLPLVGPPFPAWEPEPLRWLMVSGIRSLGDSIDRADLAGLAASGLRRAVFRSLVRR